jgi:hypothetical protein
MLSTPREIRASAQVMIAANGLRSDAGFSPTSAGVFG